jgi:hypothetical protein
MIRPSLVLLTLSGVLALGTAQADPDPRSCPIINPACPDGQFPMVTVVPIDLTRGGADPCFEDEECQIIEEPLVPVLSCKASNAAVECQAWPRSLPPEIDVSPRTPILYRWSARGDLGGGGPQWTENPAAIFDCVGKADSFGIVQLEIMSPYGLISSTSAATGCFNLVDESVQPPQQPLPPPLPTPDPKQ